MDHAGAVRRRHPGRAPRGAHLGGRVRRVPHGRVRDHRARPERPGQPGHLQRRLGAGGGRGAVLRDPHARGDVRGRLHRLPVRRQADDRGERVERRAGVGAHREAEGRRQRPPQGHLTRGGPARGPGPHGAGAAPAAHRHPARRHRLLPLRRRQGGRRPVLHLPHRLHRGGRLRALLPRPRHRRSLEGAHRRRRPADRPRRPGLAPAGDGLRPLRQRHRRHHHAAGGRARLDRQARQGLPVHGRQGAPGAEAPRRDPQAGRASGSTAAGSPATATRSTTPAATWTWSGAAP